MVGPSPFKRYSFREAYHILGPTFVICWSCRRYVKPSLGDIGDRDIRTTTFSCSKCGGEGQQTTNDPAKDLALGDLNLDPVDNPQHHPAAMARLARKHARSSIWFNHHRALQERRQ